MKNVVYKIKIISLCLFAFSLGIEYWDPFGIRDVFTITKFAGLLYTFLSLFNFKKNFAITIYNKLLVYSILLLWFWMTLVSLISSGLVGGDLNLFLSFLQPIVLFWLVFNDVLNNLKVRNYVFLSFITGIVLVSILLSFGIGIENVQGDLINDLGTTRIYFMGMNPNRIGDLAAIAILLVFSLIFSGNNNKFRYILLLLIPSLLAIVGYSGSRGSFLVIFLGLSIFFILRKSKNFQKFLLFVVGIFSSILIYEYMSDFELLQNRLNMSIEVGETGGRLKIWENVFNIIQKNPIFGVGKSFYDLNMSQIYGIPKDSHNIFLFVWAVSGIVGLMMLLVFYIKALKNSWLNLKHNNDATNIMIYTVAIFIVSKSGGAISLKVIWLMFACITPVLSQIQTFNKVKRI